MTVLQRAQKKEAKWDSKLDTTLVKLMAIHLAKKKVYTLAQMCGSRLSGMSLSEQLLVSKLLGVELARAWGYRSGKQSGVMLEAQKSVGQMEMA